MVSEISTLLEFKLVDNFHRIVNLPSTFSISDMVSGNIDNEYKLLPVSACQDNWASNVKSDYKIDRSKITLLSVISTSDSGATSYEDIDPATFELVAETSSFGGLTVSFSSNSPDLEIGSEVQFLKGVFLVNANTDAVLAYCILPNAVPVVNYIRFPTEGFVVEIKPTVSLALQSA